MKYPFISHIKIERSGGGLGIYSQIKHEHFDPNPILKN